MQVYVFTRQNGNRHSNSAAPSMKYVSVYQRSRSPFWYISFLEHQTGLRKHKATVYRVDQPMGRRKALEEANELSKQASAFKESLPNEIWEAWVEPYLKARYKNSDATRTVALHSWSRWREFVELRGIRVPRAVNYNTVIDFVAWRTAQKRRNKQPISVNTAARDVVYCSVVMQEAKRRGYCAENPCRGTGIVHDPVKLKPEITAAEEMKIHENLSNFVAKDPDALDYMPICFEIAMKQGCRLHETEIPFDRIDFERNTVTLHTKGGKRFATLLHPTLRPMLLAIRDAGHSSTCIVPKQSSLDWRAFFDSIGLKHLCFHCTRVTVVTRLARAGVPISQAMSFVGHSSSLVHRIYTRLQPGDLSACVAALT